MFIYSNNFSVCNFSTDAYDFLIDSGGQAETFSDFNRIFNSSLYFNSTFDGNFSNTSIFPQSNIIETNISDTSNNTTTIDSTEFDVITAVVSIVLALVILITIIGESNETYISLYSNSRLSIALDNCLCHAAAAKSMSIYTEQLF